MSTTGEVPTEVGMSTTIVLAQELVVDRPPLTEPPNTAPLTEPPNKSHHSPSHKAYMRDYMRRRRGMAGGIGGPGEA